MGGLEGPPIPPTARPRPGSAGVRLEIPSRAGEPRRAPHTPHCSAAPRLSRGAPRDPIACPGSLEGPPIPPTAQPRPGSAGVRLEIPSRAGEPRRAPLPLHLAAGRLTLDVRLVDPERHA